MKKIIYLLLISLFMVFNFCSCNSEKNTDKPKTIKSTNVPNESTNKKPDALNHTPKPPILKLSVKPIENNSTQIKREYELSVEISSTDNSDISKLTEGLIVEFLSSNNIKYKSPIKNGIASTKISQNPNAPPSSIIAGLHNSPWGPIKSNTIYVK